MSAQTFEDTGIRVSVAPSQSAFFAGETFSVTVTFTNTRTSKSAKRAGAQAHKRAAHSISLAPLAKPPTSPVTPRTSVPVSTSTRTQDRGKSRHERKGLVGLGGNGSSAKDRIAGVIRRFHEDCLQFDENVHAKTARVMTHILIDTSLIGHESNGRFVRCGSINKVAFYSQIDDAPQDDDPVQAETLPYLRTRPADFTAGDSERH